MPLYILTETSAGYALLKAKSSKLLKQDDLASEASTAEGICNLLKLKTFEKFDSAATALEEAAALGESKVTPLLTNLLSGIKDEKFSLAVADKTLGSAISRLPGLSIAPISGSSTEDIFRAIRSHLPSLIPGLLPDDLSTMSLGLSHSMSRHKLKFSPDKVDTMIIQAIALLDDLDKELNTYAMRVKEWYGWHFPEMAKVINDNLAYAKVILKMGYRKDAAKTDLAEILPEEIETAIKAAAEISMGSDINSEDLDNIRLLAEQVVDFTEYRTQLSSYLGARMQAIAPNLTTLVGELVGARLIAHAGSLINLAKSPASTIQILGAEKALFRALKTKHDTPKYGLLFHASLVGQATGRNKGKIARALAGKVALGLRADALSDWGVEGDGKGEDVTEEQKMEVGLGHRLTLERRLRALEGKPLGARGIAIGPSGQQTQPGKWDLKETRKYNADADGLSKNAEPPVDTTTADAKSPQKLIEEVNGDADSDSDSDSDDSDQPKTNGVSHTNGDVPTKAELKAAKAARKAERAEKRTARAAKKAAKESKHAAKESKKVAQLSTPGADEPSAKKRKRVSETDAREEKTEKKKKKRHSAES